MGLVDDMRCSCDRMHQLIAAPYLYVFQGTALSVQAARELIETHVDNSLLRLEDLVVDRMDRVDDSIDATRTAVDESNQVSYVGVDVVVWVKCLYCRDDDEYNQSF